MALITITEIGIVVSKFWRNAYPRLLRGDVDSILPMSPKSLDVYIDLKNLERQAKALGYNLDDETVRVLTIDSEINA